jgi:hypothetical protein
MREHTIRARYEFSFNALTTAFWSRFPNALQKHIVYAEVIDRSLDVQAGVLKTTRLLTVDALQDAPRALQFLLGRAAHSYTIEISTVDAKRQVAHIESQNLSYRNLFDAYSMTEYRGVAANETLLTGSMRTLGLTYFRDRIEHALEPKLQANAQAGVEALEAACRRAGAK